MREYAFRKKVEALMYETPEDIQQLQDLLDRSITKAGVFLRQSFEMPDHSLSARQLVHFWQGMQTIAFATVTRNDEPRVAPIGALLFRGQFYIPTVVTAARTKHILHYPAVSFTFYQGNGFAVIAHGTATIIEPNQPNFADLETLQQKATGTSVREWGEGVFLQITSNTLFTYARDIDLFSEG
jgi:hypothetical protein